MSWISSRATTALVAWMVAAAMSITLAGAGVGTSNAADGTKATSVTSATTARIIGHNDLGTLRSRIVGTTASGDRVTGSFVPLRFIKRDGRVKVRGLVQGVVHRADGTTERFADLRTVRVRSINGTPVRTGRELAGAAACDILHLVLGPLDLDLLGLKVHLDRIVLNIDAEPGPGNLLGNLLCAVAGLLDGGLDGQLGTLTRLLNRILGLLNLGA